MQLRIVQGRSKEELREQALQLSLHGGDIPHHDIELLDAVINVLQEFPSNRDVARFVFGGVEGEPREVDYDVMRRIRYERGLHPSPIK